MNFADEFRNRTKKFALRSIRLYRSLPNTGEAQILGKQYLRAATSVAGNFRSACRGRSKKEFTAKLGVVVEEADECVLWLELIIESGIMPEKKAGALLKEANEIMKISATSHHTAKLGK